MTPKSPSDFIGKFIESDDKKFCVVCKYEVCSHAFLRKEVDQLEEAITLERSEADKLRGEVERLLEIKPIIEALKSGKERGTITIDREAFKVLYAEEIGSLRQQLAEKEKELKYSEDAHGYNMHDFNQLQSKLSLAVEGLENLEQIDMGVGMFGASKAI